MANNQNSSTITGDVKSRIDKIWDTLWAGGITVPVTILEQLTYLFFIKLLDDKQRHEESNAIEFGYELEDPLFKKGQNGQFRTPRHIIRMIITMAEPKIDDVICDPAMGSAGFIMEAAKQIYDQNRAVIQSDEDVRKRYYSTMFNGFDTDQTMLRIGAMNMLLHGIPTPNIKYQDSLSEDWWSLLLSSS